MLTVPMALAQMSAFYFSFITATTLAAMEHLMIRGGAKFLSEQFVHIEIGISKASYPRVGVQVLHASTFSGVQSQLFTKLSPRAKEFVPRILRKEESWEEETETALEQVREVNMEPKLSVEESQAQEEQANRLAEDYRKKSTKYAIIIQRRYKKKLDGRRLRRKWNMNPLSTKLNEFKDLPLDRIAKHVVFGPLVEILLGLEDVKRKSREAKERLQAKFRALDPNTVDLSALADFITKAK